MSNKKFYFLLIINLVNLILGIIGIVLKEVNFY